MIRGLVRGLERRATLAEPPDWMWDAFGATPGYAGRSVTVPSALRLVPVFAAVRITAGIASSLPMDVYSAPGQPATSAASFVLTQSANPEMPADQYLELVFAHIELHGNHFAEKVRNRAGQVGELWPIDPTSVTVERDRDGRRRYRLQGRTGRSTAARSCTSRGSASTASRACRRSPRRGDARYRRR